MKILTNEDGTETIILAPWDLNGLCRDVEAYPDQHQLVSEIRLISPDERRATMSEYALLDLLDILRITPCKILSFASIEAEYARDPFEDTKLPHLQHLAFDDCQQHLELMMKFAAAASNLESFFEYNVPEKRLVLKESERPQNLSRYLALITTALDVNPRLTIFECPSLLDELRLTLENRELKSAHKTPLKQYQKMLPEYLRRNQEAYRNYRQAMYQVLLIKKFRPNSLFQFVNRDIVRVIVEMIKASKWHKVWRR